MSRKLYILVLLIHFESTMVCRAKATENSSSHYEDEPKYFLHFETHQQRVDYIKCIQEKQTNVIFLGNYTRYGHKLRTHTDCFKQSNLEGIETLIGLFRDYKTLQYYLDEEYHNCFNETEAILDKNLTKLDSDFNINIRCMNDFKERVVNFQVKSYPWVMGFDIALLTLLILLGLPANTALLLVLWRYKEMHTTANIFIANLASADLMNIIVYVPLSVLNYVQNDDSKYGDIICKCIMAACDLFMIVSVYTFICMSAYRYMGIRCLVSKSSDKKKFSKRGAVITVVLVWVLACCLCVHSIFGTGVVANHCFFRLGHEGYMYRRMSEIVIIFLAPFAAITYFCVATSLLLHRSAADIPGENQGTAIAARKKSANVPIALIIQFFVCHFFRLTFLVIDLWCRYSYHEGVNQGMFCFLLLYFIFSSFLAYFHSCLPPIMLFFTSSNVRGYFKAILKTWFRLGGADKQSVQQHREVKKKC